MTDGAREERLVKDMAKMVGAKVHDLVKMHGMTMETAGQAALMGADVAAQLALDVATFAALSGAEHGHDDAAILALHDKILAVVIMAVSAGSVTSRAFALAKANELYPNRSAAHDRSRSAD